MRYGEDSPTGTAMMPEEIAIELGCSESNVSKLLFFGIRKLRKMRNSLAMQNFRKAVEIKRAYIDAREPNVPWLDIDAGV